MDMETVFSMFFMIFGIGFFIYVVWKIELSEDARYQRRLNEAREFGYKERLNPPLPSKKDTKTKKS